MHPTGGDQVTDVRDLSRLDLREPDSTPRIADALRRQGMAVFCGVSDRAGLLRAGHSMMTIRIHRDSDGEGVTTIERRFSAAMGSLAGFTERELVPHTDGSAVAEPPRVLMLTCVRRPRTGGQVVLVDGCGLIGRSPRATRRCSTPCERPARPTSVADSDGTGRPESGDARPSLPTREAVSSGRPVPLQSIRYLWRLANSIPDNR